jgi:hypothetical protein
MVYRHSLTARPGYRDDRRGADHAMASESIARSIASCADSVCGPGAGAGSPGDHGHRLSAAGDRSGVDLRRSPVRTAPPGNRRPRSRTARVAKPIDTGRTADGLRHHRVAPRLASSSYSQSPTRFIDVAVITIITPGIRVPTGFTNKNCWPSESISPQSGVPAGGPRPR